MDDSRLIYTKNKDGRIFAAGYAVNSKLMASGNPAISSIPIQSGGGFETLAVPAGLFLLQQSIPSSATPIETVKEAPKVLGEDLYTRLLSLVAKPSKKQKRLTRKRRRKKKRKNTTRRA